jgi:hypothetical protein
MLLTGVQKIWQSDGDILLLLLYFNYCPENFAAYPTQFEPSDGDFPNLIRKQG